MTFICDSSFADRFLLEAWQSAIYSGNAIANVDRNGDAGGNASSTQQEGSGSQHFHTFHTITITSVM